MKKYNTLRFASKILAIYGWILGGLSGFAFVISIITGNAGYGFIILIGLSLSALFSIAMGQLINVFIDIEYNTRRFYCESPSDIEKFQFSSESNPVSANRENSIDEWKCPKCWHLNPLPTGKCGYCSYGK